MTVEELNLYLKSRAKHKFVVVPFIYGYNEDGKSIFTIYDEKIKSFSFVKSNKKGLGFQDYMMKLKYEMMLRFPNFSLVTFVKFGTEYFLPYCELSVNTIRR